MRQTAILLSDTHGSLSPEIAALLPQADLAIHAGDIGNAGILTLLRAARRYVVVRGNNDIPAKWPAAEREALLALPDAAQVDFCGETIAIIHGHQCASVAKRHAWLRRRYATAGLVVYGHSHRLCIDDSSLPWVVNPGAAGRSRTFGGASCIRVTVSDAEWQFEELRFPQSILD